MAGRGSGCRIGALALLALLAACGRGGRAPAADGQAPLRLSFEDRAEPEVFSRQGPGVRDGPKGSPGLWAAVRGLPRPERALVVNTATGAKIEVALFAAPAGGPGIRLSNEAADALGIATRPMPVQITALRRVPEIDTTKGRF